MSSFLSKRNIVAITIAVVTIVVLIVLWLQTQEPEETLPVLPPPVAEITGPTKEGIGISVEGRPIEAYSFGSGSTSLLFVGGIHGGYEWNSTLLAYEFIDHLTENPATVPDALTITIIPSANPDGTFAVIKKEGRFSLSHVPANEGPTGTGRFNAHNVDLNRNFGCKWQPQSTWRGNTVSAGTAAFSEPEAQALRDFVLAHSPAAVVFWHSQSNAVYASECENGILPGTRTLMNSYATAAGYPAVDVFDAYEITGDAEGWLASINIPAITVELSTHETIEWERNLKGFEAVLKEYSK